MRENETIEEIVLAQSHCCEYDNCLDCRYEHECLEVFGKELITDAIEKLASQCKAFNEFARANRKEQS